MSKQELNERRDEILSLLEDIARDSKDFDPSLSQAAWAAFRLLYEDRDND